MVLGAVELIGLLAATWLVARGVEWVYLGNEHPVEPPASRPSGWS